MTPVFAARAACAGAAAVIAAAAVAACGSGDSTAARTPDSPPPAGPATPVSSTPVAAPSPASPTPAPADPCAVDLAAPAIAKAVSELPRDPRSGQGWNAEPVAGNFSACAPLSAVIVRANTNAEDPATRAVMFNLGAYVSQGVPDTIGFNGIDTAASTPDTVVLTYSGGVTGLDSVVRFRWNGSGVELTSNLG